MASLRQEVRYGLSCGETPSRVTPRETPSTRTTSSTSSSTSSSSSSRVTPSSSRVTPSSRTLYHVKLTDTAIRALEAYQNLKESLPSQPSICFKGNQGFIKIPAPSAEAPDALRLFSFYLSSDSKDQPQASFDCIHQYVSREGRDQLEGQGSIQDKITVCATDDSYQVTRERLSQAEKDSWSRAAIEIKPGATHPSKSGHKFHKRPLPVPASVPPPPPPPPPPTPPDQGLLKHSPHSRRAPGAAGAPGPVAQRPLKERVIHLLALKPYRKPELLLWLDRERAHPRDKTDLGHVLEEVARLSAKDSGYLLRDDFYRLVQKDWPGYSEDERQLLGRVLARKLHMQGGSQSRASLANPFLQRTSEDSTQNHNTAAKNQPPKRPVPSDPQDSGALKRPRPADAKLTDGRLADSRLADSRLADARLRPHPPPVTTPTTSTTTTTTTTTSPKTKGGRDQTLPAAPHPGVLHAKTGVQTTTTTTTTGLAQSRAVAAHNGPTAPTPISPRRPEGGGDSPEATGGPQHPALAGNQHKKKKSKKHKDKERERERLRDPGGRQWLESSPDLKQSLDKLHDAEITNAVQSEEKPDYVLKYPSISSLEQRQRFQTDFCGEYSEYIDLHARIANVTHMFVQLASKIKSLSPGTQQHKIMEDQIMEKYKKYRNKFPGYREEKKRCEYLHEKLSHIKQLITDYDVTHASSSPSS